MAISGVTISSVRNRNRSQRNASRGAGFVAASVEDSDMAVLREWPTLATPPITQFRCRQFKEGSKKWPPSRQVFWRGRYNNREAPMIEQHQTRGSLIVR